MFNSRPVPREIFYSNPPLPDLPRIVPEEVNGVITNKVIHVPASNHSLFEGVHFSPETMSLRAKLNLGVSFSLVSLGQIENDPNVLMKKGLVFEQSVQDRLNEISSASIDPSPASIDPSPAVE